ncbi:MAG: peptidylprolyl isomerase [Gammaproteobacteria bacterium]|nr:peptidylprolyl isomerase [Gammaproteobacteria bacterium]
MKNLSMPNHSILLILLLLAAPLYAAKQLDSIVAVVNDDVILKSELDETMKTAKQTLQARKMDLPPESVLQQQVLGSLIIKQLQLAHAARMNLSIDDGLLNQAMENFARQQGLKGLSELKKKQTARGVNWGQFREQFREEVLISELQGRIIRQQVNVSQQEVDNYLASLQTQGQVSVEYHWAHILISPPQAANSLQIDASRRQAESLQAELQKGADFAKSALTHSKGRNALKGGDMGWAPVGQLPTLFSTVVPGLQAGQVSQVLRSPSGFHIVKLLEVRNNTRQGLSMEQLRNSVRSTLEKRKFDEQLEQWLLQTRDAAYVEIRL